MKYSDPAASRTQEGWKVEILHDGRSVSRLWIVDRHMRIGAASISIAGIAGVGTNNEHRKRGLALRVLQRSLQLMQEEGYDASFLFGIEDFYHKVGFATCMPEHGFAVDTRVAESIQASLRTRPMKAADRRAVRTIYEQQNRLRTASIVRAPSWNGFPMGSGFGVPGKVQVVHTAGAPDKVLGYVLYDGVSDRCRVAEVGTTGDDVSAAILSFLARHAVRLRREWITASLPPDHPFALYCRRFGYRDETRYARNAGPMGRVIDSTRFFTALAPELASRWPADALEKLTVRSVDGAVTLVRKEGTVDLQQGTRGGVSISDPALLMQLAMGYRDADDAISAGTLTGTRPQLALTRALFPLRVAHMSWPDRF
jgi:predicted acetyltransferase